MVYEQDVSYDAKLHILLDITFFVKTLAPSYEEGFLFEKGENMEETGIRRTESGGVFCEKCGADLSVEGSVRFTMHMDGTRFYVNQFECVKCGACITQTCERKGDDAELWAE